MKIDEKLRGIITDNAKILRDEMLDQYVVQQPHFEGVDPEDQMLTKICVLVAACSSIIHAAEELNKRLSPDNAPIIAEEQENKEWN